LRFGFELRALIAELLEWDTLRLAVIAPDSSHYASMSRSWIYEFDATKAPISASRT